MRTEHIGKTECIPPQDSDFMYSSYHNLCHSVCIRTPFISSNLSFL